MFVGILLLTFLAIAVFLWVGTLFLQGFLFTEPAEGLHWRAPASAGIITLFLAFWTYLSYQNPGRYDTLFRFSPREEKEYTKFWSLKQQQKSLFELRKSARGRPEYKDAQSGQPWTRSDAIIVEDDGHEVRFDADRDKDGNYKLEKTKAPAGFGWFMGAGAALPLQYHDASGRVMTEDSVGKVSISRWSLFLMNIFLNLTHFLLWFACLWFLLRYTWAQAFGLAIVLWLFMTIPLLPMLLTTAEDVGAQKKLKAKTAMLAPINATLRTG